MNKEQLDPSKMGVFFALASILINISGYTFLYLKGGLGALTTLLLYTGFGLPFIGLLTGKEIAGCNFKASGCSVGAGFGFILGVLVVTLMYYLIGYYGTHILKKTSLKL